MYSYFFPDALDARGNAKPITFHSEEPLEDREIEDRMLRYRASSCTITPNTEGAPRLQSAAEYDAQMAARRAS
jgi:hypothetical protein